MKRVVIYISVFFVAAALYAAYLSGFGSADLPNPPNEKPEKTEIQNETHTMPVLIWDKSCDYKNTLSCADIIAPVLFRLNDKGGFDELSSKQYTDTVSCDVWGVFTNAFDPDLTREFMKSEASRYGMCDEITELCVSYDIEGVNIDFENMYSDDSALFSDFIKVLSEKLHEKGKLLSVDVTKISRGSMFYSMCYDRAEISKYADFVILMGYDQTPRTSQTPGPVSGLDWVDDAISGMLEEVPPEKLMLGIPFYTRLWHTDSNGTVLSSTAISMDKSEEIKNQNGGMSVKSDCGLDYFEFENENGKYRVWQENENSLNARIELAKKYNLSGIACWCLGFESQNADEILSGI